jgi:hypothetical protein
MWQVCFERYTRVLMEASPEFPIHFLKIYSEKQLTQKWGRRAFGVTVGEGHLRKCPGYRLSHPPVGPRE